MPYLNADSRMEVCLSKMRGDPLKEAWPLGNITRLDPTGRSFAEHFLPQAHPDTKPIRAYIRVSTDDQVHDGTSITNQKKQIIDYCIANRLTIIALYYDLGLSGGLGFEGRPAISLLYQECQYSESVVVATMDRIGRDYIFVGSFDQGLMARRIEVRYISGMSRTRGKERVMFLGMMGTMGHVERMATIDRSATVIKAMMEKGMWRERPHFGWRLNPENRTGPHILDQWKSHIIYAIQCWVTANPSISIPSLVKKLYEEFEPKAYDVVSWTYNRVRAILGYPPNDIPHEQSARWIAAEQALREKRQAKSREVREEKEQIRKLED